MMNTREKFSAGLLGIGVILALIPLTANRSFTVKPQKLLSEILDSDNSFSVDQVARFVVSEDSTTQIIDLRPFDEFITVNIPGSVSIPYSEFIGDDPGMYIDKTKDKIILYSNGDIESNLAFVYARGLNYKNIFVMKGGLNEWFNTVINSHFTGTRITARENAIYETRTRAGKLFTDINSLPENLKLKYMEDRKLAAMKLDGGCE